MYFSVSIVFQSNLPVWSSVYVSFQQLQAIWPVFAFVYYIPSTLLHAIVLILHFQYCINVYAIYNERFILRSYNLKVGILNLKLGIVFQPKNDLVFFQYAETNCAHDSEYLILLKQKDLLKSFLVVQSFKIAIIKRFLFECLFQQSN